MSDARFVQIHYLTSYPSSLLNRDDVGFAKRIPFGGVTRTRVSSQCLKRHWRTFTGKGSLSEIEGVQMSVRSRRTFDQFIYKPLVEHGVSEGVAREVTSGVMSVLLGESAKAKKSKSESGEEGTLDTGQITVLGQPELEYLLSQALEVSKAAVEGKVGAAVKAHFGKDLKNNLRNLKMGAGLDAALFGRMVTSDVLARCDAALHVAHALTVHAEATESDYFSAVDDLLSTGDQSELGSGHIGTTELTSGLYYGYVVVDVPLLVANVGADVELAAAVVERLVRLVATVSPGAKLGSTAPHSYAHTVLVESGSDQPRTLANAFLRPVAVGSDLIGNACRALADHLDGLDGMYGSFDRRFASIDENTHLASVSPRVSTITELSGWVAQAVRGN